MRSWLPLAVCCCLAAAAASAQAAPAPLPGLPRSGAARPTETRPTEPRPAGALPGTRPAAGERAPGGGDAAPARTGTEREFAGSCSPATSRDLFSACDADADDRLDVFEAGDALETMRGATDHDGFARFDTDRDGYVDWPEFDGVLRATLQRGGTFRVRTVRTFAPPTQSARPATELQRFLQLHDGNGNGGLDPDEVQQMLQERGLSPQLGALLRGFDRDRSGKLEETEIAPYWEQLRGNAGRDLLPATGEALAPPWRTADQNRDGRIDERELAAMLSRLDAALAQWAAAWLRELDRNRDGVLQADELPGHKPAGERTAAAPGLPLLPPRAPLR
jgi:Ca2+-binding EF-hand superfamily protein